MRTTAKNLTLIAISLAIAAPAAADNCFWRHIDHRVDYNASGIWNPDVYRNLVIGLTAAEIGGAVWEGSETRFGKTMWQGVDSELISAGAATVGKYTFTRVRPSDENDTCRWFQGGSNYSFPSGEAAVAAGLVTPYIFEYGADHPAVYLLALVPLYVGAGRVKNQEHWQSDVLAGWTIGAVSGWYAHRRNTPIVVELLPGGVAVGFHKSL
jgi:membrane-associated phospholipid phosphatase